MDVRAIILVGGLGEVPADESFAGTALAAYDVLGKPVVARQAELLQSQRIGGISIVSETPSPGGIPRSVPWISPHGQFWRAAENAFSEMAQGGAEAVLVIRMGGYAEFDTEEFIQRHLDGRAHVTRAVDAGGSRLDMFVINASRRNDAAYLFRHGLQQTRSECGDWIFRGYYNPLASAADLRALAVDGLMQRAQVNPIGTEVRPGVWIGRGARVSRRARLLAPSYVGEHARVRAGAVITRCGVVEHHAEVDSGTVVENASVLPYTYFGPGLDLAHAVAGSNRLLHLPRDVEVEIADPKLMNIRSQHAPLRAVASAVSLASFLPVHIFRGLLAASHREQPKELPAAVKTPSSAVNTPADFEGSNQAPSFPANLAVARRYGEQ